MLKKLNLIIAIISLVILCGCDKQKGDTASVMKSNYHTLPADTPENIDTEDDTSEPLEDSSNTENSPTNEAGSKNESILKAATEALGESSSSGPSNGKLACAWMINKVLERSVGFKVDGNSTSRMETEFQALVAAGKAEKIDSANAKPGDVILSPTTGNNVGHVGIMGENDQILSNSSSKAKFSNRHTVSSWNNYYKTKKGLEVNIYRLI